MNVKTDLSVELRQVQTLLNCLEGTLILATVDNMNEAANESFDLLYLLKEHTKHMMDKVDHQERDGKEGAA